MKKLNYIYIIFAVMLIITLSATSMKVVLASKINNNNNEITTWNLAEGKIKLTAGALSYDDNYIDEVVYNELLDNHNNNLFISIDDIETNCTSTPYDEGVDKLESELLLDKETNKEEENLIEDVNNTEPETNNSSKYSEYEIYELAKIIMAEAEGESQYCKELVGQVIMNRVNSARFPNTIHDVIFANNGKTYQFSPVKPGGRWYRVEPNEACYEAAYTVLNASEPLTNALYFESCKGSSWHSRNLTLVIELKEDNTRFYVP